MNIQKKIGIAVAGIIAVLYTAGCVYFTQYSFPGTFVDGLEVSRMTRAEALDVLRGAAAEGSMTVRVQDHSYVLERAEIFSLPEDAALPQEFSGRNSWAWPAELSRTHRMESGIPLDFDRARAEELLREQGLFALEIAPVDARLSEYSAEGGYTVLPDKDGWHGSKQEVMDAIQELAADAPAEIDLTERFAVKAALTAADPALNRLCEEKNALVHHSFRLRMGEAEELLDGTTMSGWLTETRDGTAGLNADMIRAYADTLEEKFAEPLAQLEMENGAQYIVDTYLFNDILAARLDIEIPMPETPAQKNERERKNAQLMKTAQREAKKTKDQEEAEKLLAEAEAQQVPEPEMVAVRRANMRIGTVSDASQRTDLNTEAESTAALPDYLTVTLTDGVYIENIEDSAAAAARKEKAEKQYAPATRSNALIPDDPEQESAVEATGERQVEQVTLSKSEICIPLIEADPEFQLGYGLDYIDINIEAQHVILFENGRKVMESDCVTGTPNRARETHRGVFHIDYKQRNRILRGQQKLYASFVNYWMPFDAGIGLHDATWRGSFGGTIYKSSGSHGCVNLPLSFAKQLYARVYKGETVYVH